AKARDERNLADDVAIVRVEQLYPFPYDEIKAELAKYPNAKEVTWAQEEPRNQGAFYQIRHRIERVLDASQTLSFAGRPTSASPAVGYMSKHVAQLKQLIDDALTLN
nr:2-oxoglutarate dehydrogenase E1 component [Neisseria sp.]